LKPFASGFCWATFGGYIFLPQKPKKTLTAKIAKNFRQVRREAQGSNPNRFYVRQDRQFPAKAISPIFDGINPWISMYAIDNRQFTKIFP